MSLFSLLESFLLTIGCPLLIMGLLFDNLPFIVMGIMSLLMALVLFIIVIGNKESEFSKKIRGAT